MPAVLPTSTEGTPTGRSEWPFHQPNQKCARNPVSALDRSITLSTSAHESKAASGTYWRSISVAMKHPVTQKSLRYTHNSKGGDVEYLSVSKSYKQQDAHTLPFQSGSNKMTGQDGAKVKGGNNNHTHDTADSSVHTEFNHACIDDNLADEVFINQKPGAASLDSSHVATEAQSLCREESMPAALASSSGKKTPTQSGYESVDESNRNDALSIRYSYSDSNLFRDFDMLQAMKDEVRHLNYQLDIERSKSKPQKLVSGSQFRMPLKLDNVVRCPSCDSSDKNIKKMKENVRSLKLQLCRAEDDLVGMKKYKMSESVVGPISNGFTQKEHDDLLKANKLLSRRVDELENDIYKFRSGGKRNSLVEELQAQLEEMKCASQRELLHMQEKFNNATESIARIKAEKEDISSQSLKLKSNIAVLKPQITILETKLDQANIIIDELRYNEREGNQKEIDNLHKQLDSCNFVNKTMTNKVDELYTNLHASNTRNLANETIVSDLIAQNSKLLTDLGSMTSEVKSLRQVVDDIRFKLSLCEKENGALNRSLSDMQLSNISLNTSIFDLNTEVEKLNSSKKELARKLAAEAENVKKTVEKAILSSVRLCVVAPTVNVQVGDKKIKLKSALSEKALRAFITNDVLSKYSFLFKQETEDSSPTPKVSIQAWVQQMLQAMQKSIEEHVNSAIS